MIIVIAKIIGVVLSIFGIGASVYLCIWVIGIIDSVKISKEIDSQYRRGLVLPLSAQEKNEQKELTLAKMILLMLTTILVLMVFLSATRIIGL